MIAYGLLLHMVVWRKSGKRSSYETRCGVLGVFSMRLCFGARQAYLFEPLVLPWRSFSPLNAAVSLLLLRL